jgi:hypothetical protein
MDKEASKTLLFSEEKRSKKDFIRSHPGGHARKQTKVFWFFFSKKNILPCLPLALYPRVGTPASAPYDSRRATGYG